MAEEIEKTLEALQTAVQMEIDGKEYYLKASRQSGNDLGRKLLEQLSSEEDLHRQRFEEIYGRIRDEKAWPDVQLVPGRTEVLKTLFKTESEKVGADISALQTELDAVRTAMDMENKTYDFYKAQSAMATYDAQKRFFEAIAGEERVHHALLLDYFEFLKNPQQWFTMKERPSLEAG